ncbi:MAG: hypothetical protein DSY90_05605 [Deltaproteobacteria bacterium]|nr:MAG: hypothetical protein DSY90_05605 [Deltaproteobacteria bacterium]
MTPVDKTPCQRLVEKIIMLLASGITADPAVCAYIETTFSTPSLHDLKAILVDETHEERDSLIDLLLFPDEPFQAALSPFLLKYAFSAVDQEWVIRHMSKILRTVTVYFPMLKGHTVLTLTSSVTEAIVKRLNICWQPAPSLREVIDNRMTEDRRTAVYVRLRNANLTPDSSGTRLLCRFFETFADAVDFFECFDWMVGFIGRMKGTDGYQPLMKEKQSYVEAAQYALKFERMRQINNMETLMLQGVQVPTMRAQEAAAQVILIDRLALALYGRTDSAAPAFRAVDRET